MKILSLKGILTLFIILFSFTSCERYVTECMTPTITGEYSVVGVQIQSVDQSVSSDTFITYGICETPLPYPFDKINFAKFKTEIGYDMIRINEISNGKYEINENYTLKNCTPYSVGFMDFNYVDPTNPNIKRRMIFNVIDDPTNPYSSDIVLRHEGIWPHGKWGEKIIVSLYLHDD